MKQANNLAELEWGTHRQVFEIFGLSRSTLYKLAQSGKIKWASVKLKPFSKKGTRLFSISSIRDFIEKSMEADLAAVEQPKF